MSEPLEDFEEDTVLSEPIAADPVSSALAKFVDLVQVHKLGKTVHKAECTERKLAGGGVYLEFGIILRPE